jgi:hypothetical protein
MGALETQNLGGAPIIGYVAPSKVQNYSCNGSDTLSSDKMKCSYDAQKIYNCSNVCSSTYNNTKTSFTSTDPTCPTTIATTIGSVKFDPECSCGLKTTPAIAVGVDDSSCASKLCIQSSTFNLTIKVDNTKVEDLANGISVSSGSPVKAIATGTLVNLTATAFSGSSLGAWMGDVCDGNTTSTCAFTMDKDLTVKISSNLITCSDTCATTDCGKVCKKADCNNSVGTKNCNKLKVNAWKEVSP